MRTPIYPILVAIAWTQACGPAASRTAKSDNRSPLGEEDDGDGASDGQTENDGATAATYLGQVKAILDAKCVSCHGAQALGGARLDNYADAKANAERTALRASARTMPPSGSTPLDDDEIRILSDWAAAGAPEGTDPNAPSLAVVKPAERRETPSAGEYGIAVALQNAPVGSTYDLYRSTTQGATTGGTLIGAAISGASHVWSTAVLSAGEYYVYATSQLATGQTLVAASAGSVLVTDGVSPVVSLTGAWDGAGSVLISAAAPLTFTATDPNGQAVTIGVELSSDSGVTWSPVACDNGTQSTCELDLSAFAEGVHHRVRVTAEDPDGNSGFAVSTSDFGLAAKVYTYLGDVQPLLSASGACANCHSQGGTDAASLRWDQYAGTVGMGALHVRVRLRTAEGGGMPPDDSGRTLTAEDRLILALWSLGGGLEGQNRAPTGVLAAPWNGGGTVFGSNTGTIAFTLSDPDGEAVTVTKVEVSTNSGSTWTPIACNPLTTTACGWNAAVTNGSTYRARLTFADARGLEATASSATDVTINLTNANSAPRTP